MNFYEYLVSQFQLTYRSSNTVLKFIKVVCKDMNPEPDWRMPNGDLLPDCRKDISVTSKGMVFMKQSQFPQNTLILLPITFLFNERKV